MIHNSSWPTYAMVQMGMCLTVKHILLGKGPANVTGIGYKDGALYAFRDSCTTLSASIVTHPTDFSIGILRLSPRVEVGGSLRI